MSKNYLREDVKRRQSLLQYLGVSKKNVERDVQIFREWAKQQKHLPQEDFNDDLFIERLLLNNKFRIEQSKIKLDNYYTMKTVYSFLYRDLSEILPSKQLICRIPLRHLTSDGKWIILICVRKNSIADSMEFLECIKFQTLVTEIMNKYCYANGRLVLMDCKEIKTSMFKNFDASVLHKHLRTMKTCYSGRSSAIHLINLSNFCHYLLTGIKLLFKEDVAKRVKVHEDFESLYQDIPKSFLPKDYGGEDISIDEYIEIWDGIVKEEESFLDSLQYKTSNESLRVEGSKLDPDMFGVDGTFKKLNLD